MRIGNRKKMLCVLAVTLILTGCGRQAEQIELLEPVAANESFRVVAYGDVGVLDVAHGVITPENYCHFFSKTTYLSEICVDVGEEVTAGQVLARIDTDELESEMALIQSEIAAIQKEDQYYEKIYDQQVKEQQYVKKAAKELGDDASLEAAKTQLKTLEENRSYDEKLSNYKISKLNKELSECKQQIEDGTITAKHAGRVVYVKEFGENNVVKANENVVIVADYDKCYVELPDVCINETKYTTADAVYVQSNGKQYDLKQKNYTAEELALAESTKSYPCIRYEYDEKMGYEIGDVVLVYFKSSAKNHVLKVGLDSVNQDGDQYFVYVKTPNNGKERRDVTIGNTDHYYAEITDGLKEGECVYYSSDSMMPEKYEPYTIALKDYETVTTTNSYVLSNKREYTYCSDFEGKVEAVYYELGDAVKKGDCLMKINVGKGSSDIKRMENSIQSGSKAYKKQVKEIDKQVKALEKEKKKKGVVMSDETVDEESDLVYTVDDLYQKERITCQIKILEYQKELLKLSYTSQSNQMNQQLQTLKKTYNGDGTVSIYAKQDGMMGPIYVTEDKMVLQGKRLFSVEEDVRDKIKVMVFSGGMLGAVGLNTEVSYVYEDGKTVAGRCIGIHANAEKVFLSMHNDKPVISRCETEDRNMMEFYTDLENQSAYEDLKADYVSFRSFQIKQCVTVPTNLVYSRHDQSANVERYFVWLQQGNQLVKQYVQIDEATLGGSDIVILSGLQEGDVIANEITANEEKNQKEAGEEDK